jgi:hypothetical protein
MLYLEKIFFNKNKTNKIKFDEVFIDFSAINKGIFP